MDRSPRCGRRRGDRDRHCLECDPEGQTATSQRTPDLLPVADLPGGSLPEPPFDLVVCFEVHYYFRREQLDRVNDRLIELLRPTGRLLLLHARSLNDDDSGMSLKEFGARTVHETLAAHPALRTEADVQRPTFRATLLRRSDAG